MSASSISKSRKGLSKIPMLHPQHGDLSLRSSTPSRQSTIPKRLTSSRQIFEKNTLSNACDFLTQLKQKLEMEVGGMKLEKPPEKDTRSLNNLLVTLMDVSDTLTPLMVNKSASCSDVHPESMISEREFNRTMEATSKLVDFDKKPEHYYVSQQITLNNMQTVVTPISNKNADNKSADNKNSEKLFIDKTLLAQLEQLHELLNNTINKLVDKGTCNYDKDEEDADVTKGESDSITVDNTLADSMVYGSNTSPEYSEDEECMKSGSKRSFMNSDEERSATYRKECEELIDYIRAAAETTSTLSSLDPEEGPPAYRNSQNPANDEADLVVNLAAEPLPVKNILFKSNKAMRKMPRTFVYHNITETSKPTNISSTRISTFFTSPLPALKPPPTKPEKSPKKESKESKPSKDSLSSRLSRFSRFSKRDKTESKKRKSREPVNGPIKEVKESDGPSTSSKASISIGENKIVGNKTQISEKQNEDEDKSTESVITSQLTQDDSTLKEDTNELKEDTTDTINPNENNTKITTEETTNDKAKELDQYEADNCMEQLQGIQEKKDSNDIGENQKDNDEETGNQSNQNQQDEMLRNQILTEDDIRKLHDTKLIETQARWWSAHERKTSQERKEQEKKEALVVKLPTKESNKTSLDFIKKEIKDVLKKHGNESSAVPSRRSSFGRRFSFSRKSKDKTAQRFTPEVPVKVVMYTEKGIQNVREINEAAVAKSLTKVNNKKVGDHKDTKYSGNQTDHEIHGMRAPPVSPASSVSSKKMHVVAKDGDITTVDEDTDSYAGIIPEPDDSQFSFLRSQRGSIPSSPKKMTALQSKATSTTEAAVTKEFIYSPASVTIFQTTSAPDTKSKSSKDGKQRKYQDQPDEENQPESQEEPASEDQPQSQSEPQYQPESQSQSESQNQPEPQVQPVLQSPPASREPSISRQRSTSASIILRNSERPRVSQVNYLDPVITNTAEAREVSTSMTSVTVSESTKEDPDRALPETDTMESDHPHLTEIDANFKSPAPMPISKVDVTSIVYNDDDESNDYPNRVTMTPADDTESTKHSHRIGVPEPYYHKSPMHYEGPKKRSSKDNRDRDQFRDTTRQRYQAYDPESSHESRSPRTSRDHHKSGCKCRSRHTQTSHLHSHGMEEVHFLGKHAPARYFDDILSQMEMMKYCIEFAYEHKLDVHDKLIGYADVGKMTYPHFHTVVDGIPVFLTWREDPGDMFIDQSKLRHEQYKAIRDWKRKEKKLQNRKPGYNC